MTKIIYKSTGILAGLAILGAFCVSLAAGRRAPNAASPAHTAAAPAATPPALAPIPEELDRFVHHSLSKADPPVYFINYTLADRMGFSCLRIQRRSAFQHRGSRLRWLEVQTRLGTASWTVRQPWRPSPVAASPGTTAALDDYLPVLRNEMWRETDEQYRSASEALIKVKTNQQVQVQSAESAAPDFSREEPHTSIGTPVEIHVDRKPWEDRVRKYTSEFSKSPAVLNSIATFTALAANQYQVNSEGTKLLFGQIHYRLELDVQTKAPDGMDIDRYANFDWLDPKDAPDEKTVMASVQKMIQEAEAPIRHRWSDPLCGTGLADRSRIGGIFP